MPAVRGIFNRTLRPIYLLLRDGAGYLFFERRFGLDTMGRIELAEFGLHAEERMPYRPSRWFTLPRILRRSEVDRGDTFIDLGCGKGRIVFQAARLYEFRRVIGVDLVRELTAIAEGNLERNRQRLRCRDTELVTSDALDYEIPDDATVVYFGNPFTGAIFAGVVRKLFESLDRRPRPLRVVYSAPVEHEFLMSTGRARVVRKLRGFRPARRWSRQNATYLYELLPAPRAAVAADPR